jgi:hemerythrin-like domain-containing protein
MTGQVDVTDMYAVHNVFRDTFSVSPELVGQVTADDVDRRALVANFYANVLDFLHVHHDGEEVLVFPLLEARRPEEQALIAAIAAQHRDVDDLVARSSAGLSDWAAGAAGAQDECATTLAALGEALSAHLADEETRLLPVCAEALTPEEWGALPGHGLAHFGGDKVWLILGLIRDRMTEGQRALMDAHMPPPAVEMWTTMGDRAYRDLMAEIGPIPLTLFA